MLTRFNELLATNDLNAVSTFLNDNPNFVSEVEEMQGCFPPLVDAINSHNTELVELFSPEINFNYQPKETYLSSALRNATNDDGDFNYKTILQYQKLALNTFINETRLFEILIVLNLEELFEITIKSIKPLRDLLNNLLKSCYSSKKLNLTKILLENGADPCIHLTEKEKASIILLSIVDGNLEFAQLFHQYAILKSKDEVENFEKVLGYTLPFELPTINMFNIITSFIEKSKAAIETALAIENLFLHLDAFVYVYPTCKPNIFEICHLRDAMVIPIKDSNGKSYDVITTDSSDLLENLNSTFSRFGLHLTIKNDLPTPVENKIKKRIVEHFNQPYVKNHVKFMDVVADVSTLPDEAQFIPILLDKEEDNSKISIDKTQVTNGKIKKEYPSKIDYYYLSLLPNFNFEKINEISKEWRNSPEFLPLSKNREKKLIEIALRKQTKKDNNKNRNEPEAQEIETDNKKTARNEKYKHNFTPIVEPTISDNAIKHLKQLKKIEDEKEAQRLQKQEEEKLKQQELEEVNRKLAAEKKLLKIDKNKPNKKQVKNKANITNRPSVVSETRMPAPETKPSQPINKSSGITVDVDRLRPVEEMYRVASKKSAKHRELPPKLKAVEDILLQLSVLLEPDKNKDKQIEENSKSHDAILGGAILAFINFDVYTKGNKKPIDMNEFIDENEIHFLRNNLVHYCQIANPEDVREFSLKLLELNHIFEYLKKPDNISKPAKISFKQTKLYAISQVFTNLDNFFKGDKKLVKMREFIEIDEIYFLRKNLLHYCQIANPDELREFFQNLSDFNKIFEHLRTPDKISKPARISFKQTKFYKVMENLNESHNPDNDNLTCYIETTEKLKNAMKGIDCADTLAKHIGHSYAFIVNIIKLENFAKLFSSKFITTYPQLRDLLRIYRNQMVHPTGDTPSSIYKKDYLFNADGNLNFDKIFRMGENAKVFICDEAKRIKKEFDEANRPLPLSQRNTEKQSVAKTSSSTQNSSMELPRRPPIPTRQQVGSLPQSLPYPNQRYYTAPNMEYYGPYQPPVHHASYPNPVYYPAQSYYSGYQSYPNFFQPGTNQNNQRMENSYQPYQYQRKK